MFALRPALVLSEVPASMDSVIDSVMYVSTAGRSLMIERQEIPTLDQPEARDSQKVHQKYAPVEQYGSRQEHL